LLLPFILLRIVSEKEQQVRPQTIRCQAEKSTGQRNNPFYCLGKAQ